MAGIAGGVEDGLHVIPGDPGSSVGWWVFELLASVHGGEGELWVEGRAHDRAQVLSSRQAKFVEQIWFKGSVGAEIEGSLGHPIVDLSCVEVAAACDLDGGEAVEGGGVQVGVKGDLDDGTKGDLFGGSDLGEAEPFLGRWRGGDGLSFGVHRWWGLDGAAAGSGDQEREGEDGVSDRPMHQVEVFRLSVVE